MFDDLLGGLSDFFGGAYETVTSALGTVGSAIADIPSIASSAARSLMPDLLGGSNDMASVSPAAALFASDGVGSAAASGGFAAPAVEAAKESFSLAPDPMQAIFGTTEDPMIAALSRSPASTSLDQMITDAARGATAAPTAGGSRGLVQSILDASKANPMLTAAVAGGVKSMFSPDQLEIAREKARAEAEAKMQLAQWLKDNNRAGGIGVNLNMRPAAAPGAVQRLTGEPVYQRGGLIAPYVTRGA